MDAVRAPSPAGRHCWVSDVPGLPSPLAGLLVEWRHVPGGWSGRVLVALEDDAAEALVVEAWVPSAHLSPLRRTGRTGEGPRGAS